jgi:hypothetical protein
MYGIPLLICLLAASTPQVQVTTLSGDRQHGALEAVSATSVTLNAEGKSIVIPYPEVLVIRSTQVAPSTSNEPLIELKLVDNSRIRVQKLTSAGNLATIVHSQLGELKLPLSIVSSVRLAPADPKVDGEWTQLTERIIKKDLVAIRKGDVLDHLDGVIGGLGEATMQFQLEGDNIPIKREKVFGLIFSKRESSAKKATAQFALVTGDRLAVKQIDWNGTIWKAKLASGLDLEIPADLFQALDCSLGKVTYLSDLEPRSVKFTPFFAHQNLSSVYEYRRDKDFEGNPITLFERPSQRVSYEKGLAIHSRNVMKYRLGNEYRRFQSIMGIGAEVPNGEVDIVIKGDQRVLFEGTVKALEADEKGNVHRVAAQKLDLDVTGVVELEILVDWGRDTMNREGKPIRANDIGDRLYLANARVIK